MTKPIAKGHRALFSIAIYDHNGMVAILFVYRSGHIGNWTWRWTLKRSGNIIACSSEAYSSRKNCLNNVNTILGYWGKEPREKLSDWLAKEYNVL